MGPFAFDLTFFIDVAILTTRKSWLISGFVLNTRGFTEARRRSPGECACRLIVVKKGGGSLEEKIGKYYPERAFA